MVLSVVPSSAVSTGIHTNARCAGCGIISVVRPSAVARIVSALVLHASAQPSIGAAAQPAVPADRCAHEIVRILTDCAARVRQLNGNPLDGNPSQPCRILTL